jgi:TolB-like protein/Tfp pilus assembly protein PilF
MPACYSAGDRRFRSYAPAAERPRPRPTRLGELAVNLIDPGARVTDIFLSYNREDQARAKLFAEAFEAQGFQVWWDVGLRTGEAYDEVTEAALRMAKAVVVLWSKKSVASRWVRAEATLADRNKTLLPCMIEPCERPIMFELTQTAELSHWQGDAEDRTWVAFLDDVKRFLAKEAAPATAASTTPLAAPTVQETLKPGQSGSAPSLAVLPFTNRSGLPEDEVFAEGMVEDLIWALSQGVNVRVLGSMATANLSRTIIADPAALGRQLGVRYLLEGNVRRVGGNLRVTTQLIEAATGTVLWAAKFDRPLTELADLQEELVTELAGSLDTQVYALEMERALKKPSDITAWEAVARSSSAYRKVDAATLQSGIKEARRAVAIAPDFAPGHAMLAVALANAYLLASPADPAEVERIRAISERALALAPDDASVLNAVGSALCFIGSPEEGERYTGRAVRKAPGSGVSHQYHGVACAMLNRLEEAMSHLNTAARLMPGSHLFWAVKAWHANALIRAGRWGEGEAMYDECLANAPDFAIGLCHKAMFCWRDGRKEQGLRIVKALTSSGLDYATVRRTFGRVFINSPTRDEMTSAMDALWAEARGAA